ncbi:sensor histidine kinase [Nocardioides solisilvae]|uniref:sensor histidine kinase n=1 Tax=Nocardioides solisilvae TaxID=1542435 RepID=UPI0019509A35|nr:histidine kinase [Nocardioides solisilvae]
MAASVAVVSWGLALLALSLLASVRPALDENLWFLLVDVSVACVYGTVAAVVLSRRPHPVGWIVALAAVGGGAAALGYALEAWWQENRGDGPPGWLDAVNSTAWVPGTLAIFLVVPWLVRDHPLGRARAGVAAGALVCGLTAAGSALVVDPLVGIGLVLSVPLGLLAALAVELRRRRGPAAERNGLGWLAVGTLLMALSFVPLLVPLGLPLWVTPVLHLASQVFFPAAILVAVLRGRMWGLDLAVSRAVLAGAMTLALLVLYLVVVALVGTVLPGRGSAQVVAAGVVAVAVQPLRLRLERRVRRLVHGAGADPARVVSRLGSQLDRGGSVDGLLADVAEDLGRSMRLESVTVLGVPAAGSVAAEDAPGPELAAWGVPTRDPHVVPLRHRGRQVGSLAVTAPPGEALGAQGERTLGELSPVVAAAVAVRAAEQDVADLRRRLALARVAERRLIRREVHDGLGPSLAGLRLGLQGVRNLLDTDPDGARELLDVLGAELDERVVAVRELSHQLLPPVLVELGLEAALAELAAREETGPTIHLDLADTSWLDLGAAAAVHAIVAEAVTNVRRHAGATRCLVSTWVEDGALVVTVRDDGRGVPDGARHGVGTQAMTERAEEQGGRVEVLAAPGGGTLVRAVLPTGRSQEQEAGRG